MDQDLKDDLATLKELEVLDALPRRSQT